MAIKRSKINPKNDYTVTYSAMRGVDFSSAEGEARRYRFSYLENMYKDYEGGGAGVTESVPGFRKIASLGKKIHAIYVQKGLGGEDHAVIHAADSLYRFKISERDSLQALSPIKEVRNEKGTAFCHGTDIYVLDGENLVKIGADGVAITVGDSTDAPPYVPTTYYNGEEYEQRNLLTDLFVEKYLISAATELATESEGLKYQIISAENKTAKVVGCEAGVGGEINIPSYTVIGGEKYKVTSIGEEAFAQNRKITRVYISTSIERIERAAFTACLSLSSVIIGDGVKEIGANAFAACDSLVEVYIGGGVEKISTSAFAASSALKEINYALDEEALSKIEATDAFKNLTVKFNRKYKSITVEVPIFSPMTRTRSVTADGEEIEYSEKIRNDLIYAILITVNSEEELNGREISVAGEMDGTKFTKNSHGDNLMAKLSYISGADAIRGCKVSESFDGRIFLSGNPLLPNTVFYTSRDKTGANNPLYFGVLNYFNDGTASFPVTSLLATADSLAVFKSGDDGGGSIYYHTPRETGVDILPKIYPVSYIHSGIAATGASISFFDDPIFLSSLGVCALSKKQINLERSIAIRSHNVNPRLLAECLEDATLVKWCGYLALIANGNIYLADSRETFTHASGNTEYEWYFMSGIGTYKNEREIYEYSPFAVGEFAAHERAYEEISGVALSTVGEDGKKMYYTVEDGVRYAVYPTGEARGGIFSPASAAAVGEHDVFIFGTLSGDVCVFNNDKRGVAPPYLSANTDFDAEEYEKEFGRSIHPYYYSFAKHAPRYAITTVRENGGLPHFCKATVKGSLAVKLRTLGTGRLCCEVGTDRSGYREICELPHTALNFGELDFSALSFTNPDYVTIPLKEREKGWIEKDVSFYTDAFSSPFGICSVSYRFNVKGKIKF